MNADRALPLHGLFSLALGINGPLKEGKSIGQMALSQASAYLPSPMSIAPLGRGGGVTCTRCVSLYMHIYISLHAHRPGKQGFRM